MLYKIVNNPEPGCAVPDPAYDHFMATSEEKITQHVAAFNVAVESGEWERFADRFATDAVMRFTNVPAGPFHGRAAIARGYVEQPPDEPMRLLGISSAGQIDTIRFAWASGATGTMELTWHGQLVAELAITFDAGLANRG
jgi:steroid delta-isomerase